MEGLRLVAVDTISGWTAQYKDAREQQTEREEKEMKYEMKRTEADPFDLMCSDCEVHYIEYWEAVTEEELREEHGYLVIEDKYIPDIQKEIMKEECGWEETETDFDKWLEKSIADGWIRRVA